MCPEVCSPTAVLKRWCDKNHLMPSARVKKTDSWASAPEILIQEIQGGPRDSVL